MQNLSAAEPLLFISQWAMPTGIARASRAIVRELSRWRPVDVVAIDGYAAPCDELELADNIRVFRNPYDWDVFGETLLRKITSINAPSDAVIFHDPWHVPRFVRCFPESRGAKIWAYCPIDGVDLRTDILESLLDVDGIVTPTAFGKSVLTAGAQSLGVGARVPFDRIHVIPHGLDNNSFFPIGGGDAARSNRRRHEARSALFPDQPSLWDGMWILNANRNTERKRLDVTLGAFARFCADKPLNVRLHLPWMYDRGGIDLRALARRLGVEDRLVPDLPSYRRRDGLTTSDLNIVYNAADIGVNTARGEGFGLVSLEHGATAAAQITPRHSACAEIWSEHALTFPPVKSIRRGAMVTGWDVAEQDLTAALQRYWDEPALLAAYAEKARKIAASPVYQWENIGAQWAVALTQNDAAPRTNAPS